MSHSGRQFPTSRSTTNRDLVSIDPELFRVFRDVLEHGKPVKEGNSVVVFRNQSVVDIDDGDTGFST
ncbi:hypothetical protein WICPIJ_001633 [Wickerhamomyces pijperi]|uniref:Uncharacterized protein n=1 Tax=Wickerhamomyces pijperi TaxID=599730 RepID=A0A9P8QB97_WICPI|nr:hypothetical protein WICPIJ_001633 [Wickerhamomyces pijperi]